MDRQLPGARSPWRLQIIWTANCIIIGLLSVALQLEIVYVMVFWVVTPSGEVDILPHQYTPSQPRIPPSKPQI
jgi:hypothetical protein